VWAQTGDFSKDDGITRERLGLPPGNSRTSEPFVTRIYKTDDWDRILKPQPKGYPFTLTGDYALKDNETARVHEGVDAGDGTFGHGGAYATNMTLDGKRGLITVFLVQHAGFPQDGGKSHAVFKEAAEAQFGKSR
jgi:hypothetical protein